MSTAPEAIQTEDEKMRQVFKECFCPQGQAPGAIENGKRVVKINSKRDDHFPNDLGATVLASHCVPIEENKVGDDYIYFVAWDWCPGYPLAVRGNNIKEVTEE